MQLNILYTWNVTIYTNYDYILYHMINFIGPIHKPMREQSHDIL